MLRLLLILLTLAAPAFAQDGRRLMTSEEAERWTGVGRINIQGSGFCTGALIAEDLVLTAAHCVFHKQSRRMVSPDRIHFLAGWRLGEAAAHRTVKSIMVHRDYSYGDTVGLDQVSADIAVLELNEPIPVNIARPFERESRPKIGQPIAVVSYARDRSEAPSIEAPCATLTVSGNAVIMSCEAEFGASGSPVFTYNRGIPKIVSVVSAKATQRGQRISLGMTLDDGQLQQVITDITRGNAFFEIRRPGAGSISEQLGRGSGTGTSFQSVGN